MSGSDFDEVIKSCIKFASPFLFAFIDKDIFLEKARNFGLQNLFMITNDIYKEYYFKMNEIRKIYNKLDLSDETRKILDSIDKLKTKSKMFTAIVLQDLGIQCEMPNKEYILEQLDEALATGKIDKTDYENCLMGDNHDI